MMESAQVQPVELGRELDRLFRFLTRPGPRFGLGLAICRDPTAAEQLRERLRELVEAAGVKVGMVVFDAGDARTDLVARMRAAAQRVDAVFVVGLDRLLLDDVGRIQHTSAVANLNQRRDSLPTLLDVRVVFWLGNAGNLSLRDQAWDLRQIMLTVADFEHQARPIQPPALIEAPGEVMTFVDASELDEVVTHADTLTQVAEQAKDPRTRADAAFSAGQAYASARRFDASMEWLARAVAAYDGIDAIDQASAARAMIGRVLFDLGRTWDAIAIHERALADYTKLGRFDGQANELSSLGLGFLEGIGESEKAIEFHERALAIDEQLGRLRRQAVDLANLGVCYRGRDVAKAIEFHERALAIHQQLGHLGDQAEQLSKLGFAHFAQGDLAKALDLLEWALSIWNRLGDCDREATTLTNLGFVAVTQETPDRARDYLTRAVELHRRMGRPADHPKVATVSRLLADLG
jgi:tetratricopeptide (TPR) repeat protein